MLTLLLLAACDDATIDPGDAAPTWNADVAPIVAAHCGSCHTDGGIAPFSLDDYASAAPMASSMEAAVAAGTMPPWGAEETDECQPRFGFKDDVRLSDDEKATLAAWVDAGAPEGDAETAVDVPAAPELGLADATQEVSPATGFVASGSTDEFRCFSIDPGLATDAWLTGLQVEPGNAQVVHHVLVFADPDRESAALVGEDGTYDCFGGSGLGDGALLGAWAPGAFPFESPEGAGIPVTAGSLLVMQIHYHPAGETAAPDSTTLQLRWQDTAPAHDAVLALLGNASSASEGLEVGPDDRGGVAEFRIPADVAGHTEEITYRLGRNDGPYQVFMAGTHMHYVGTDMRITVDHAEPEGDEPAEECMVQTPRWDFNWQRGYSYDAPLDEVPVIRPRDTIRMRCTYDNTLANPGVRTALADVGLDEPQDVYLGEATTDEMCLGVFGIVY
jgi:hypothetical protein